MRILVILVLIFSTIVLSNSQNYVPFPTDGAHWNIYLEYGGNESPPDTFLLRYVIGGDTVINSEEYTKLLRETGDTTNPLYEYIGALREDGKRIYYRGNDYLYTGQLYDYEILLYDFSAGINDTILHIAEHPQFRSIIDNIDSIIVGSSYRKRYEINSSQNYNHQTEIWIEGIGSVTNGLLGHITSIPTCCYQFWEHVCYKDQLVELVNPHFNSCYSEKRITNNSTGNNIIFAPDDAVWHYTYDPDITWDDGYKKIEVVGDTVINLHNCKILKATNIGYSWWDSEYYEIVDDSIFLCIEDSVVYYLKSDKFYILHDFTAKQGDSFTSICYPHNCDSTFLITIDKIDYIIHNQDSLRKYHININNNKTSYYYVENIGYPDYLLPMFNVGCEELTGPHYPGPLRCYQDSIIGLYSTGISSTCDYITGLKEKSIVNRFSLYPNPTQGFVRLSIKDNHSYTYEIRDIFGRLMDKNTFHSQINIDLIEYRSGLYIVTLKSSQQILGTIKILKY